MYSWYFFGISSEHVQVTASENLNLQLRRTLSLRMIILWKYFIDLTNQWEIL